MRILRIFDVSSFIHVGKIIKHAGFEGEPVRTNKGYAPTHIPTGGVSFLFNMVYNYYKDESNVLVFAFDRDPLFRKRIEPKYKSNRIYNSATEIQKFIAEHVLFDCGFNVCFAERYEADDIIYTICQKYKDDFDVIYIHTNDSDVYVNVDSKTTIYPVRKTDKLITFDNYETAVSPGRMVPYNTCNFYKMIYGDTSDCYDGLSQVKQEKLLRMLRMTNDLPKFGNTDIMLNILKFLDDQEIIDKCYLAYPQLVNTDIDIYIQPDPVHITVWGHYVGNKSFPFRDVDLSHPTTRKILKYIQDLLTKTWKETLNETYI